jgi:hypothetical protein
VLRGDDATQDEYSGSDDGADAEGDEGKRAELAPESSRARFI